MYKHLMSLLMVATLACGFAFAEDEKETVTPAVEATEEVKEVSVAECGCNKKKAEAVEAESEEQEEATLAECGCKKKKSVVLANEEAQKKTDEEIIEETDTDTTETLVCNKSNCPHYA